MHPRMEMLEPHSLHAGLNVTRRKSPLPAEPVYPASFIAGSGLPRFVK